MMNRWVIIQLPHRTFLGQREILPSWTRRGQILKVSGDYDVITASKRFRSDVVLASSPRKERLALVSP